MRGEIVQSCQEWGAAGQSPDDKEPKKHLSEWPEWTNVTSWSCWCWEEACMSECSNVRRTDRCPCLLWRGSWWDHEMWSCSDSLEFSSDDELLSVMSWSHGRKSRGEEEMFECCHLWMQETYEQLDTWYSVMITSSLNISSLMNNWHQSFSRTSLLGPGEILKERRWNVWPFALRGGNWYLAPPTCFLLARVLDAFD